MLIHAATYFPPPSPSVIPLRVEVELGDIDRSTPIPTWPFKVEVTLPKGEWRSIGGSVEALDEVAAKGRALAKAVGLLAEMLAEFAPR